MILMLKNSAGKYIIAIIAAVILAGNTAVFAAGDSENEFEVKPEYIFVNKGGRDPFWPKHKTSEAVIQEVTDISNFQIVGLTESDGVKAVLFQNKSGGNTGFVFMDGKLYGDNNKIIQDVSGEIKSDTEILLRQGDREVLFTISESAKSPNIRPSETTDNGQQESEQ